MITGIRTHIFIGGLEVIRSPFILIESERHKPLSRAEITIADPMGNIQGTIKNDDAVEIRYGYRDEDPAVWKGTVSWKRTGTKDQAKVGAVGEELPLTQTLIKESFENETPEAIVKWAVGKTGLSIGRIDSPGVTFPRFVASNIPVWQVARQCAHTCEKAFGLNMSRWALWMGASGKINWGDFDDAGDAVVATGAGLIKHSPATDTKGLNMVETFLIAGFMHSQTFRLIDTRRDIDSEFRALKVRHEIKDRSVRTFIWYGVEHEKY